MLTQLWSPITLRITEDGGDMFSETSVLTGAILFKVPEDICQYSNVSCGYHENDVNAEVSFFLARMDAGVKG
jgi:hypothetical protein